MRMNIRRRILPAKPEAGQQIVMMAFLMIGLIAALGLAIDGGRLYFARRDTQNAVDAAILAATHALCTGRDPIWAGEQAAKTNGLDPADPDVTVTIAHPPIRAMYKDDGTLIDEDVRYFVDVYITKRIESFFIHVVYSGELSVTSDGVGFCVPPFDPRGIPAVWAGATTCDTCGDNPSGNSILTWTGSQSEFHSPTGLFFSNGNIFLNGSEAHPSIVEGDIEAHCDVRFSGTQLGDYPVDIGVEQMIEPPTPYRIEDFEPGGYLAERARTDPDYGIYYAITPQTVTANPGVPPYSWVAPNGNFEPDGPLEGLYYVEGYPVRLQPSKAIVGVDDPLATENTPNDVWNGFSIAATQEIKMVNPIGELRYYIGGILFFSDFQPGFPIGCNMSETGIEVSGYSSSYGVIIAPWSGIQFSANSTSVVGALIGQFVWMRGADMYFEYNPDILDPIPPRVQMAE